MLAFRSLDSFRALREPDRRRRDEERLSRSEHRTLSKTQNNHLTGKAPYKFESGLLQRGVSNEPSWRQVSGRPSVAGEAIQFLTCLPRSRRRGVGPAERSEASQGSPRGLRTGTLKMDIQNGEPQACPSNRVIRPLLTAIAG